MMSGVQVYNTAKTRANIPYGQEFDSISPMPTQISPFGTYGMTREEFEAQRGPRIGDVKASDIYGDVSLPSLPDMPMIGTTPELQRRRAREELDPISPMRDRISDMGTYGSTPEEFDAIRGSLGVGKASSAFAKKFGEMTQESLDEAAPNRQFIVDLLSGKFAYEPESVARAKRGESLFPPTQQTATTQAPLNVPEDPFGMLRSDATGLGPLRSNQNILQQSISQMALVDDQPIVTDVASSSAVTNDAQTGAVAPKSTGTEITEKEVVAGLSDVTPEDKVNRDIAKSINYTSPDIPALVAPNFANIISEQERRLAKIREDAKRDVGAQALINLGAGIAEGDVSGGLVRAGEAAAKVRAAERAAESDIANLQTRIKMAEEQGRFDTAKALRADALKEAQFEATFGLKRGELAQTLQIAEARIEAEGNTEKGRALRARLTALNDLASRLQAQMATTGIKDPATDAALQQALSQLQSLLGVTVADSDESDPVGIRKTG
jgi:hypothetical protein